MKGGDVMEAAAERAIGEAVDDYLRRVAAAIERDAKRFVPVDTGDLQRSIKAEEPRDGRVRIVATEDYASYVEDGTRHMAAQPYLKPALYRVRGAQP